MVQTGISLKAYSPRLAGFLGLTPLAVYERQRALVRIGALPSSDARGPNSGVRATPKAIATVLIAALFADALSDIDKRLLRVLRARPTSMEKLSENQAEHRAHVISAARQWEKLGRSSRPHAVSPHIKPIVCPFTGGATFVEAVENILASKDLALSVSSVSFNRSTTVGTIAIGASLLSEFGKSLQNNGLEIEARISGATLLKIGSEVAAFNTITEHSS